ncbi:hypothetical protein [Amycolatopsis sp. NPDC051071]|uniref:hypothetical protein n=1 Tax=Amycolatopsis sp. NPDC051071 TaxID=3154637 RepID=UPI00341CD3AC
MFRRDLEESLKKAQSLVRAEIPTKPEDAAKFHAELEAMVVTAQAGIKAKIPLEVDEKGARESARRGGAVVDSELGRVASRANAKFDALKFLGLSIGLPAAASVGAAGVVAALAIAGGAFAGLGVYAALASDQVQSKMQGLSKRVTAEFDGMASILEDETVAAVDAVGRSWDRLAPQIRAGVAASAPAVRELTGAATDFAENAMPRLITSVKASEPALKGLRSFAASAGTGLGEFFENASHGSESAGRSMEVLGRIVGDLESELGTLLANLAQGSTGPLMQFQSTLNALYGVVNTVTTSGMPALQGATAGFLGTLTGALTLVNGFASGLGSWAGPLAMIIGQFKALDMLSFGKLSSGLKGLYSDLGRAGQGSTGLGNTFGGTAGKAGIASAALIVLGVALKTIGDRSQDAADHQSEHASTVDRMTAAFRESKGVIDANVRAMLQTDPAYKRAAENAQVLGVNVHQLGEDLAAGGGSATASAQSIRDVGKALIDAAHPAGRLGQTMQDNLAKLIQQGGAAKDVSGDIEALAAQYQIATGASEAETAAYAGKITRLYDLAGQYNQTGGAAEKAAKDTAEFNRLQSEISSENMRKITPAAYAAQVATASLQAAFAKLNEVGGDVAAKGQAIIDVMLRLSGQKPGVEEALQAWNDGLRGIGESFKDANIRDHAKDLIDASGAINTVSDAGSKLQDTVQKGATGFASYAQSLKDAGTPADEIRGKLATMRDEFAKQLKQLGLNDTQIGKILDHYQMIPDKVITQMGLEGDQMSQQQITDVINKLKQVPAKQGITVDALTEPAVKSLQDLGNIVVRLPDGKFRVFADTTEGRREAEKLQADINHYYPNMRVGADTSPAEASSSLFVDHIGNVVGTMNIDANTLPAGGKLTAQIAAVDGSKGTMTLDARRDPATRQLQVAVQDVNGAWGWMTIDAFNNAAKSRIGDAVRVANGSTGFITADAHTGAAESALNYAARDRTAYIRTITVGTPGGGGTVNNAYRPNAVGNILTANAKGNILKFFAGGGFEGLSSMSSMAQIVPPNTWRVVGDNMRVPESYIPLDPRSGRSQRLLDETNARMGRGSPGGGVVNNFTTTVHTAAVEPYAVAAAVSGELGWTMRGG